MNKPDGSNITVEEINDKAIEIIDEINNLTPLTAITSSDAFYGGANTPANMGGQFSLGLLANTKGIFMKDCNVKPFVKYFQKVKNEIIKLL